MNKLEKRYGLITAISVVIGIVIGSGVFFKAEKVLIATGGDLTLGIIAWIIGGLIMISCASTFSILATKYNRINGVVDYAEELIGEKYGYFMAWFLAYIYYPALTSVISWVVARYTVILFGSSDITSGTTLSLAAFYMVLSFGVNLLSPKLADKFQISTTIIKLIPIFTMAIIGTIIGLNNGMLVQNFSNIPSYQEILKVLENYVPSKYPLFTGVVATAFAYEGWIVATSINSELNNPKRDLPKALFFGTLIVVVTYILYYIGLSGVVSNIELIADGQNGVIKAFSEIFSSIGGTILFTFVVISCLGTLFGITMGAIRGPYSIAIRGRGPNSKILSSVDSETKMPMNSGILSLVLTGLWLFYFYGANLRASIFGVFTFDSSELPIVTMYSMYILIFIKMIIKEKDLGIFRRLILPILAILSSIFMVVATFISHGVTTVLYYLVIFVIIQLIGLFFYKNRNKWKRNTLKSKFFILFFILCVLTSCNRNVTEFNQVEETNTDSSNNTQENRNTSDENKVEARIESLKILNFGDLLYHDIVSHSARDKALQNATSREYDYSNNFEKISHFLKTGDIVVANFEGSVNENYPIAGYPLFNVSKEVFKDIFDAGITILGTANNHALDSRLEGVSTTIQHIKENNLQYFGTQLEGEKNYLVVEKNGIKVGLFGYTNLLNGFEVLLNSKEKNDLINYLYDEEKIKSILEKLKNESVDYIIAYPHWGSEYQNLPNEEDKIMARKMIELGVNAVIGGHPHVVQPSELYEAQNGNSGYIIYSVGNFISNQRIETMSNYISNPERTEHGVIVELNIEKDFSTGTTYLKNVVEHPTWVQRNRRGNSQYFDYSVMLAQEYMINGVKSKEIRDDEVERATNAYNMTIETLNISLD